MKKGLKGFIVGVIVTMMLTGVAYAGGITKTIKAVFNSVNIAVNGQKVTADNILYEGTTYVPLRAISEMLGKDVVWDSSSNTANINDKGAAAPSVPPTPSTPAPVNYNRTNPAPIGVAQRLIQDNIFESYTAEVVVKEVVRGEKAWNQIKEANMFNEEPGSDEEYILAKIRIKAIEVKGDKQLNVSTIDFDVYSEGNTKYEYASVVEPEPSIDTSLFSGGEHEGYVVFKVKKTDSNPRMVYGLKYDGTGGIWFNLK